jgi:UDP-2,3-diacylglucosamine pyrophosphatase LpxH
MKTEINTLIISDIHLGSEVARPKAVRDLLMQYEFKRLILLGDIFDSLNFSRLKKEHWNLLSYIRKLSNPDKKIKVIWVEGNHDEGLSEIMSHLIGIKVYKEYFWISRGKKYIAIHGHQFDRFLNENIIISSISSYIYYKIQKYDREKQNVSRFIKRRSKGWLRLSNKVADGAISYAKDRDADFVICGHTHQAIFKEKEGTEYFNTGCWTDIPSTYITIDNTDKIELKEYKEQLELLTYGDPEYVNSKEVTLS